MTTTDLFQQITSKTVGLQQEISQLKKRMADMQQELDAKKAELESGRARITELEKELGKRN